MLPVTVRMHNHHFGPTGVPRPQMCGDAQSEFDLGRSSSGPKFIWQSGALTESKESWGDDHAHSQRREKIRREIEGRLRRVCPEYLEEERRQLAEEMAERQLSGERRENRILG